MIAEAARYAERAGRWRAVSVWCGASGNARFSSTRYATSCSVWAAPRSVGGLAPETRDSTSLDTPALWSRRSKCPCGFSPTAQLPKSAKLCPCSPEVQLSFACSPVPSEMPFLGCQRDTLEALVCWRQPSRRARFYSCLRPLPSPTDKARRVAHNWAPQPNFPASSFLFTSRVARSRYPPHRMPLAVCHVAERKERSRLSGILR